MPIRGKTKLRSWTDPILAPYGNVELRKVGPCRISLSHAHEATRNMAYGYYEQRELAAVRKFVRAGDTVLDVGANVGYFAAHLAEMVGAQGRVYAFEPAPTPLALLRQTAVSNRYGNIDVLETAVSDRVGTVAFFETEAILSRGYGRCDTRPGTRFTDVSEIVVPVTTLDQFVVTHDIGHLSFIKIDVEGHEKQVVCGMSTLLASGRRPVVMTEVTVDGTWRTSLEEYAAVLEAAGYEMHRIGRRLEPCAITALRTGFHGNVMWIPRSGHTVTRVD
jgi:FkbM family methyltransferase